MFKYIKLSIAIVCCCLLACTTTENKTLGIKFSSDSNKIVISNIETAGLYQLKTNIADSAYQRLVTVLQTPAEDDSIGMEIDWPGKLSVNGDSLLFTPTTPFIKGKQYLVETMINTQFATGKEIVKGDVGHHLKPQQQLLFR